MIAMLKEMDLGGVFLTPVLGWAVLALAVTWALCRLLHRIGLYRWIWHRHLFDLGLYAMVFAAVTFIASRSLG